MYVQICSDGVPLYLFFKLIEMMLVLDVINGALQVLESLHPLSETIEVVGALNVINGTGKVLEFVHVLLNLGKAVLGINIVNYECIG